MADYIVAYIIGAISLLVIVTFGLGVAIGLGIGHFFL